MNCNQMELLALQMMLPLPLLLLLLLHKMIAIPFSMIGKQHPQGRSALGAGPGPGPKGCEGNMSWIQKKILSRGPAHAISKKFA